ncbi:transglycosylase SLT domain-containing protein [Agilicoccus flavus]|uniref:transglycosylase SLT domain-containing protein n=1 Tax=Agilicoccus flavus TaxID=2775968 RepID=UPI001CF628B3|nr:transglycosylase SLT domain-containing protein [Agilicoccus flavus]
MTVEATGIAGTQGRIAEIQARVTAYLGTTSGASRVGAGTSGAATTSSSSTAGGFDTSMRKALTNAAPATAAAPFVWDPSAPPTQVATKPGAAQALAAPPATTAPSAGAAATTRGSGASGDPSPVAATSGPTATTATSGPSAVTATDGTARVDRLVASAKKYLGVPYRWGGTNPRTGLDCSGFTQLVYRENGISLPRVARAQQDVGTRIGSLADAKAGDLLFFGDPATHVTMYLGDGKMIHAPRTGDVVKIAEVYRKPTTIRRYLPDSAFVSGTTRGAGTTGDARLDGVGSAPAASMAPSATTGPTSAPGVSAVQSARAASAVSAARAAVANAAISLGSSSAATGATTSAGGWAGAPVDDTWGDASATAAKSGVANLLGDGLGGVEDATPAASVVNATTAVRPAMTRLGRTGAALPGSVLAQAPATLQALFTAAEAKYGVSADLLAAVAKQESNFTTTAVSHAGARGLMQLMPGTARGLGVRDSFDPAQAVDGAARLLRDHLKTFDGSVRLALAAYNAGAGAVRRYDGVPPYAETQNYVRKIMANLGTVSA